MSISSRSRSFFEGGGREKRLNTVPRACGLDASARQAQNKKRRRTFVHQRLSEVSLGFDSTQA
jgi:hypothetical protein